MNGASENEEFLTVEEVASLLKLNQQTVRNWITQGSLPAVRMGRRVRIRRAVLEQRIRESETGTASTPAESTPPGPTGDDFWGGEPVGAAELTADAGSVPTPVSAVPTPGTAEPTPAEADR